MDWILTAAIFTALEFITSFYYFSNVFVLLPRITLRLQCSSDYCMERVIKSQ